MPLFRVPVTVTATFTFEVEVQAENETTAAAAAIDASPENLPEDFTADPGYCQYSTVGIEALTAVCPGCDTEHPVPVWSTRLCHCQAIGHKRLADDLYGRENIVTIPHLIVNTVCTRAPWAHQDDQYCQPCADLKYGKAIREN